MRAARGQGVAEYVIVLAVIAIAAVGVQALYGDSLRVLLGLTSKVTAPEPVLPEAPVRRGRAPADAGAPDAG